MQKKNTLIKCEASIPKQACGICSYSVLFINIIFCNEIIFRVSFFPLTTRCQPCVVWLRIMAQQLNEMIIGVTTIISLEGEQKLSYSWILWLIRKKKMKLRKTLKLSETNKNIFLNNCHGYTYPIGKYYLHCVLILKSYPCLGIQLYCVLLQCQPQ